MASAAAAPELAKKPRVVEEEEQDEYHPVLVQPPHLVQVMDFTSAAAAAAAGPLWTIGRYDEDRAIYTQPLFAVGGGGDGGERRTVHMGIDLGGPVGSSVHAFSAGKVIHSGYNAEDGDYGAVLVVEHELLYKDNKVIYALYGHLSRASLALSPAGRSVRPGEVVGWLGDVHENGNWAVPHVHFQLAWERPLTHDLPGAVSPSQRAAALLLYPDPRLVLGRIYAS